jgi:membrane-associated phospholipid phosphatase
MVVAPVTFGTLIYGDSANTSPHKLFAISLLFTTVLIIIVVLLFKKKGQITNLDISEREQRVQPLVYGSIIYAIGFLFLNYFDATPLVKGLMFCYAINTTIVWGITRYWKISIHAIGLGGPFVALWLFGFQFPIIMGCSMILLCTSRVVLKAHTPAQVLAGASLAMGLAYLELTYLFLPL